MPHSRSGRCLEDLAHRHVGDGEDHRRLERPGLGRAAAGRRTGPSRRTGRPAPSAPAPTRARRWSGWRWRCGPLTTTNSSVGGVVLARTGRRPAPGAARRPASASSRRASAREGDRRRTRSASERSVVGHGPHATHCAPSGRAGEARPCPRRSTVPGRGRPADAGSMVGGGRVAAPASAAPSSTRPWRGRRVARLVAGRRPAASRRRGAGGARRAGRPPEPGADAVVAGGATRSASVRAGLAAVARDADVVVVHDAARPVRRRRRCSPPWSPRCGPGPTGPCPGWPSPTPSSRSTRPASWWPRRTAHALVAVQTPQAFRGRRAARAPTPPAATAPTTPRWWRRWAEGGGGARSRRQPQAHRARRPRPGPAAGCDRRSTRELRPMQVRVGQGRGLPSLPVPTRRARWCSAAWSWTVPACAATATATRWPTPPPTPSSAPPAWATSASTSPTPTPAGPAPTACAAGRGGPPGAGRRLGTRQRGLHRGARPAEGGPAPRGHAGLALSAAVGAPVTVKGKRTEGLTGPGSPLGVSCFAVAVVTRP